LKIILQQQEKGLILRK